MAALLGRLFFIWSDDAVEPILFLRQRPPRCFHALVTQVSWLVFRTFGEVCGILGILSEMIRLFHGCLLCGGHRRQTNVYNGVFRDTLSTLMNSCSDGVQRRVVRLQLASWLRLRAWIPALRCTVKTRCTASGTRSLLQHRSPDAAQRAAIAAWCAADPGVHVLTFAFLERGQHRLRVTLFLPGIAAVVIAADFPVARRILLEKLDALQPF